MEMNEQTVPARSCYGEVGPTACRPSSRAKREMKAGATRLGE